MNKVWVGASKLMIFMLLLFVEVHAQKELKVFAQSFVALTLRIFLYYLFYLLNLEEITEAREEKKNSKICKL